MHSKLLFAVFAFANNFSYAAHTLPIPNSPTNRYYLTSVTNGKCLDASHVTTGNNENLVFWACGNTKGQEIQIYREATNPDLVTIYFPATDRCLDVKDSGATNGTAIQQWPCKETNKNQKFLITEKNKSYRIQPAYTTQFLDLKDGNKKDGAALQLWDYAYDNGNQSFHLQPAVDVSVPENVFLLSFQTDGSHKNNIKLQTTLEHYGWKFEIFGFGLPWGGFATKVINILKKLKEHNNPEDIFVISDTTDVLANTDPEEFLKNYLRVSLHEGKHRIVASSENACCTEPMKHIAPGHFVLPDGTRKSKAVFTGTVPTPSMEDAWMRLMIDIKISEGYQGTPENFNYLNSGMYVGRAKDLIHMFEYIKAEGNESDQALLSEYHVRFPERIQVDYQNQLFSNANGWAGWDTLNGCFFRWDKERKRFYNTKFESVPALIQAPGKYWYCYDHLYNEFTKETKEVETQSGSASQ